MNKRATNLAVIGDLGRTPYYIDLICGIIKYMKRIDAMGNDSLLFQTLQTSKELHNNSKHCCVQESHLFSISLISVKCEYR